MSSIKVITSVSQFRTVFARYRPCLTWKIPETQNLFFLHGALHIYYAGSELRKLTWEKVPLIEQIQGALKRGEWFPLMVAEGKSEQKLTRIKRDTYLSRAYQGLSSLDGALFLHGLSLGEKDQHVLTAISGENSRLTHLFISIFESPESDDDSKRIKEEAKRIADQRNALGSKAKLEVCFYDAKTARVWG